MFELPKSFKEKYCNLLGEKEASKFFAALSEQPKKAFRLNSLKNNYLKSDVTKAKSIPHITNAYYGQIEGNSPEWVSGYVYSQDPAAMFPALIGAAKPGERVLDLCAAPGGKSTALGEELQGQGLLVANDISRRRVKDLRENIERWGISNALITNDDPASLARKFPSFFDLVLVDAPCSGEGMFRKNPAAISYWSPAYILKCARRQKEILKEAVKMIKPGGRMVYSTCTFSPEEDEQIVSWLVRKYNFKICPLPNFSSSKISYGHPEWTKSKLPALKGTLRFWPQDGLGEGQFAALLANANQKEYVTKTKTIKPRNTRNNKLTPTKKQKELIQIVLNNFNLPSEIENWSKEALIRDNHVFIPAIKTNLQGLRILNNGIELGILKKNRFEPGHQLAEVLGQVKQTRVVELPRQKDYLAYLHGETMQISSNLRGFVLVSYHQMIFSFGKLSANGTLKNHYPKGLRI